MSETEESTPMKSRGHHCGSSGSEALNKGNLSNDEIRANLLSSASSTVSCIRAKRGRPKKRIGKRKCNNWNVRKTHSCKSTNNNTTSIESTKCPLEESSSKPDIVVPLPTYLTPRRSERIKHIPTLASPPTINPSNSQSIPSRHSMRLQGISPPSKFPAGEDVKDGRDGSSGSKALNKGNLLNDETKANVLSSAPYTVSSIGAKRGRPKKRIGKTKCKHWSVRKRHGIKSTTNNNATAIESTECPMEEPSTKPDIVMPLPTYLTPRRSERIKHRPTPASPPTINPSNSQTTPSRRSMRLQGISPPPKFVAGEDESSSERRQTRSQTRNTYITNDVHSRRKTPTH